MKSRTKLGIAGLLGGLAVGSAASIMTAIVDDEGASNGVPLSPATVSASDRRPSVTSSDWVTFADHVALVSVTKELPDVVDKATRESGEGIQSRVVSFRVDSLLWSSPESGADLPVDFDYLTLGWVYKGRSTEESQVLLSEDTPRFERGHSYIVAFEADPCPERPELQWRGLGSYSAMPADRGIVGNGEFRSEEVLAYSFPDDPAESFRRAMSGQTADDVRMALMTSRVVPPGQRPQYLEKDCASAG